MGEGKLIWTRKQGQRMKRVDVKRGKVEEEKIWTECGNDRDGENVER